MPSVLDSVLGLLLVGVLLTAPGCREVSQPALDDPSEPKALFPIERNGNWGYITRSGTVAIGPQFDRAYRFVNNRALIANDGQYGFIDTTGSIVIPSTFGRAWHFSEGMAPVRFDSLWGFVDRSGTMVVEPQFERLAGIGPETAGPPSRSAPARSARAKPLLVSPPTSPPPYFSEDRARIRRGGRWGYVDRQGRLRISPRFARAWAFRDGLARVQFASGEMGYIARNGTVVWPPSRR